MEGKSGWSHRPDARHASPGWYVNGQGQTMVVFPGPVEFLMGSPLTEPEETCEESPARAANRPGVCPGRSVGDKKTILQISTKLSPRLSIGAIPTPPVPSQA